MDQRQKYFAGSRRKTEPEGVQKKTHFLAEKSRKH
jgi:hypothetical protein